jgi:endo-1,4-beta-xylanase
VPVWDVVNEPLDASGRLAANFWSRAIGRDYIEQALVSAHRADPAAKLVINEMDVERPGPKADALFALVSDLKRRGVPLDGVGIQMHLDSPQGTPPYADLVAAMRRYAEIGVTVEVTELDVPTPAGVVEPGRDPVAEQAAAFERVVRACRDAGNCTGFTTWGVADIYSWRGPEARALMFHADFAPKPQVAPVEEILGHRRPATLKARRPRCVRWRSRARRPRTTRRRRACRARLGAWRRTHGSRRSR